MNEKKQSNMYGNIGAILGIIGLILSCIVLGIIPAIIGLICSIKGYKKKELKQATSILGMIASIIAIVFSTFTIMSYILFFTHPEIFTEDSTEVSLQETEISISQEEDEKVIEAETEKAEKNVKEINNDRYLDTTENEHSDEEDNYLDENEYWDEEDSYLGQDEYWDEEDDSYLDEEEEFYTEQHETTEVYSLNYLKEYLDKYQIEYCGNKTETKMDKLLKENSDIKNVEFEDGGLKEDYIALTNGQTNYFYIGKTKDNRPDGFGVLLEGINADVYRTEINEICLNISDVVWEKNAYHILYAGNFVEGRYDGDGILFISYADRRYWIDTGEIYISDAIYNECDGDTQTIIYRVGQAVNYCGKFKNGKFDGEGEEVQYNGLDTPDILTINYGSYKKGEMNGKCKEYNDGWLVYDGMKKKGKYDGKGILYYAGTKQVKYNGKFKDGVYNGKGSLYDENGNIIYKGKWKNGDYAN